MSQRAPTARASGSCCRAVCAGRRRRGLSRCSTATALWARREERPLRAGAPRQVVRIDLLQTEQLIQEIGETAEAAAAVQRVRETAEQVAEQVARARLAGDRQVHLVEVHDEAEQVEVQWPECQVEDRARARRLRAADGQRDRHVRDGAENSAGRIRERAAESAREAEHAALVDELEVRQRSGERASTED